MSGHSTYLAALIEGWVKGTGMPTAPAAVYLALFNGDPTDAGTGGVDVTTLVRPAGRVAVTFGTTSGKSMANTSIVDFGTANASATMTHFGIFDALTNGNMLGSGPLASGTATVSTGIPVSFPIGNVTWVE